MAANNVSRLRPWLRRRPAGKIADIYAAFLDELSLKQICIALENLETTGELQVVGTAYQYSAQPLRSANAQRRIWAVIRGLAQRKAVFSSDEAAILAEASQDYAKKYLVWLARQGLLAKRGSGRYALVQNAPLEAPHWHRRREEKGGLR